MKTSVLKSIIAVCILLTGCRGSEGEQYSSSLDDFDGAVTQVQISTSVIQHKAIVGQESRIKVETSSGNSFDSKIVSVKAVSDFEECRVTFIDGMTFGVYSQIIGECRYEYSVGPIDSDNYIGYGDSFARVSVSETAQDNMLPNLAKTTDVTSELPIDLESELENVIDTNEYKLDDNITVLGSGAYYLDGQTIVFVPSESGVTRLLYSMSNGIDTKLGNIDVAVSDIMNTAPTANNYIREGKLAKDMAVEVDLTDFISDPEDNLILDSIRAYNAETEIISPTEHTFMFQSSEPGPHEVAYTVTDGRGGYAVAQVYIEVEADFSLVQDWDDVTVYDTTTSTDITFTSPVSKALADYTNTGYTTNHLQDGVEGPENAQVVSMNLKQAKSYCGSRGGRLPISREWELLLTSYGNLFHSQNWPAGVEYWSADMLSGSTGRTFHAATGSIGELDKELDSAFVTCVLLNSEKVNDFETVLWLDHQIDGEPDVFGEVRDPDGIIAPYQDVKLVAQHQGGVFSNEKSEIERVADSSGKVHDKYVDIFFSDDAISACTSSSSVDTIVHDSSVRGEADLIRFGSQKPHFELDSDESNSDSETVLSEGEYDTTEYIGDYGFILDTAYQDYYEGTAPIFDTSNYKVSVVHDRKTPQGNSYLQLFGHNARSPYSEAQTAAWNPVIFFDLDSEKINRYPDINMAVISFRFKADSDLLSGWSSFGINDAVGVFAGFDSIAHPSFPNPYGTGRNDFGFAYNPLVGPEKNLDVMVDYQVDIENVTLTEPDENGWRKGQALVPISSDDLYLRVQVHFEQQYEFVGSILIDDIRANLILN